ncbi:uracil-DNA glycosylase [Mycoplasma sp. E35C]|uniref:uracil-DNA glycosylase n=1 Tax=Mycoplasma sp. E35C TaxID=2801918 RepID=UPI001CA3B5E7|nr:uracil-DNA glycosylase [Mycoplasma sp. E35C]QZX49040.1 uracil-DNA glycosylase [Mycoplasma sp. E35C]
MLDQLINQLSTNWKDLILDFFNNHKHIYSTLNELLIKRNKNNELIPKQELIFNAFNYFDYQKTKVVIIGQDPYADINKANGLCFGTYNKTIPVSLRNILKELSNNFNQAIDFKQFDASLTNWAKQDILLINTILTVQNKKPLSDINQGWEFLIKDLIIKLLDLNPQPIFILWGTKAQNFVADLKIDYQLKSAHPSFFSAKQFFNNNHFKTVNELLIKNNLKPIKWF